MRRWVYLLPAAVFAGMVYLLYAGLFAPPANEIPSALIGKPAPAVSAVPLDAQTPAFRASDLRSRHVTIVNVWASWCVPCRIEAPILNRVAHRKGVQLYGMVYKDHPEKARAFLNEVGNPFARINLDANGRVAINWGVYDVPETFVIDGQGIIRWRYSGPISSEVLSDLLLPAIKQAQNSSP